ncbi:hypothetical protein PG996_004478 [Apiospora saccharicola]|uniref:Uncharacterized protein n=1 Tax=Apiospora saccharicola TaxID=335842 RepID=A0ABR1W4C2_9PEZI
MERVTLTFDFDAIPRGVLPIFEGTNTDAASLDDRARVAKRNCIEVLCKYFSPGRVPRELMTTCHDIIKILPGKGGDMPPKEESPERVIVCNVFLDAAEQIPSHHPFQIRLVQLMTALGDSPKAATASRWVRDPPHGTGSRRLPDLDVHGVEMVAFDSLYEAVGDRFEDSPTKDEVLDGPAKLERARRWININAFCAKMLARSDFTKRVVTSKRTLADVLCRYLRVEDPVSVAEAREAIVNFLPGEGDPSLRDSGGESMERLIL